MTILRPCVTPYNFIPTSKGDKSVSVDNLRQQAADLFWNWAEERICRHTEKLCESGIRQIVGIVSRNEAVGERVPLILSQSATSVDTQSAYDKLGERLFQHGVVPVRIRGSRNPSLESVQATIIGAVVGVTSSVVFSDSSKTGVPLKGLDLSVLEDIGNDKDLAVIIEEGDSIEKELLYEIIKLVFHYRSKVAGRRCHVSLILDTDIGSPLIEEVIEDESIFAHLLVSKIPLIDARELSSRIRSVFFETGSEINLYGFPLQFSPDDSSFLAKQLPAMTLSPMELCEHILLLVRQWFKRCQFSFLAGCITGSVGTASEEKISQKIERDLLSVFSELSLEPSVTKSLKLTKASASTFQQLLMNNLEVQQRLAMTNRVLKNFLKAVRGSNEDIISLAIDELTAVRFSCPPDLLQKQIDKCLAEIQSRRKEGRAVDAIVAETVRLNEDFIDLLVNELGMSVASGGVDSIAFLNEQIQPLATQKFNQTKLIDEYFSILKTFLEKSLGVLFEDGPVAAQQQILYSLFSLAPVAHTISLTDVGTFDSTVAFFRSEEKTVAKNPIVEQGLKEVFQVGRLVYGPGEGKKKRVTANTVDFDLITETFPVKNGKERTDFELAEALATLEYLGLVRQPGVVDMATLVGNIKVRKVYKDTPLVENGENSGGEDDDE